MSGYAWSTSSTSLSWTSLPVSPYFVVTISMAPFEAASTNPLLPATTQPAPGGPGNHATFTGLAPFGCIFTRYSPAFAPISPNDTSDLAESCGELMPLITPALGQVAGDRKSTRLNSSHSQISYAVVCLKTTHRP